VKNGPLSTQFIIWSSLIGCVMCAAGLVWGLWRFSPFARFRLRRVPSKTPDAGWMDVAPLRGADLRRDHLDLDLQRPAVDGTVQLVSRSGRSARGTRCRHRWARPAGAAVARRHAPGGSRSLPVLRVRSNDAYSTWIYLDPARGGIVQRSVSITRLRRWLYQGLHSLDFPVLYYKRPLWDVVVIVLSLGGTVLSVTTLLPAWRRLKRRSREMVARVRRSRTVVSARRRHALNGVPDT